MIIQAELKCKQTGCEAEPCAVDKVIELPRSEEHTSELQSHA